MNSPKKSIDEKQLNSDYQWLVMQGLSKYSGQWIAVHDKEIIARDNSLKVVLKKVTKLQLKTIPLYLRVPEGSVTTWGVVLSSSLSYPFTPIEINGKTVLRPMLRIILTYNSIDFPTWILVDSGADYSIIRREIVEDAFGVDISKLKKSGETCGITGKTSVGKIGIEMKFGTSRKKCIEKIPFNVSLESSKDPPVSLLGRDPFFYRYRVDFRMGYTDDPSLGKFVLYPEEHKRNAKKYKKPLKIKK